MPVEEPLHNRYALALIEAAKKEKKLDEVMESLSFLSDEFLKDEKFHKLLVNPLISREEKKNILDEILEILKADHPLDSFLHLLIDDRREALLHGIFLRYMDLYQLEKQRMYVHVETANELSPYEKNLLSESLQKKFKKEVVIELGVKPELLGGIYVRWENVIYDDTVRGKLEDIITQI